MRYYDISAPIEPAMPVYRGDPPLEVLPWSRRMDGAEFDVTALHLGSHTGTHVDAPAHCVDGGPSVDQVPLEILCGPAFVLDLAERGAASGIIPAFALDAVPPGAKRLILRTRGGEGDLAHGGAALGEEAAARLITLGIRLVGIDRLSIAPPDAELAVHRLLLSAGVVVVEGLDLASVPEGHYELICLPLKIAGCDGAPARAMLIER